MCFVMDFSILFAHTRQMPTSSRIIPSSQYQRVRWKNNLGWTREIARGQVTVQPTSDDWDWRLSIAEIEQDAAFSSFPGIDRELVLLRGNGLRLCFDDGETCELFEPFSGCRFAGERTLTGELIDGPTQDFNLMWRRDAIRAKLLHRPLVGAMVFFAEPGATWAIYLLAGQATFNADCDLPPMAAGDTAVLRSEADHRRYAMEGNGELLVAKLVVR
jgi:environmental stress-induced protein Ves